MKKNIDKVSSAYGVSTSKVKWNAGFHDKEGQPHLHLHLWTDDNTAFIDKNKIERLRNDLIDDLYANEIKKHLELTKDERIKLLSQIDSFKNILNLEFDKEKFKEILKQVNYDEFKFQRYYQYLDHDSKNVIDKMVLIYLTENKVFDKLIEVENKVDEFMYEYYGKFDNTEKHIQKYLTPKKNDRKELQNHILKMFAEEKIKFTSKTEQIKKLQSNNKSKGYSNINIAKNILNSSLISNENIDKEKHNNESKSNLTRRKNKLRNKNSRRSNIRH